MWHISMELYLWPALISFSVCILILSTVRFHIQYSGDWAGGVQKIHHKQPPRIGGVAIFAGVMASYCSLFPSDLTSLLGSSLFAVIPAFSAGLLEDLTKRVGALARLIASMASGVLAWALTGVAMQNTGWPALDVALQFLPFAVLFTGFAVGGVVNAVNVTDGMHGLASGICIIMLAALGAIADQLGDTALRDLCGIVIAACFGFFVINWPWGVMFLGDSGAYFLGFFVAWASVLLCMRNPEVNGWTAVMVCAFPLLEVAFSMLRRIRYGISQLGKADRHHLHHLLYGLLSKVLPPRFRNPASATVVWVLVAVPAIWAFGFFGNTPMLVLGFGLAVLCYAGLYALLSQAT
jgi:UDP-N-acetylmuramyl pentapeptide phosphotransferase/UDP-N-acetylglucosamine-1-phosphate transferase